MKNVVDSAPSSGDSVALKAMAKESFVVGNVRFISALRKGEKWQIIETRRKAYVAAEIVRFAW